MEKNKDNSIKTVLVISVGFSIMYVLFDYKWSLNTAIIIGVLGIISNNISNAIDYLWLKLAKVLSFIVPNILLSLVFYLILFPIATLSRIFGNKNALQLKNSTDSLWLIRNNQIEKASFEKMW